MIYVRPSGDKTGVTDTRNIKAAIDAASVPRASRLMQVLRLGGHYYFNEQLTTGNSGDHVYPPTCLHGDSAYLEYVGEPMSDYALRVFGYGHSYIPRLKGITLECHGKCRGILLSSQSYTITEQLVLYSTKEVGIDSLYCWGSELRDIHLFSCDGYAIRAPLLNNGRLTHVQVHLGKGENWPAIDDDKAIVCAGSTERFASRDRAAVSASAACMAINTLLFHDNVYGVDPLLKATCWASSIENVYMENNTATKAKIVLQGAGSSNPDFSYGDNNRVDGVYCQDAIDAECVVLLDGQSRNCHVDRISAGSNVRSIVTLRGTHHIDNQITTLGTEPSDQP